MMDNNEIVLYLNKEQGIKKLNELGFGNDQIIQLLEITEEDINKIIK